MNKIKDIAITQTGVYLKETPGGEVHYLQVKDFDRNKRSFVSFPSIKMPDINKKHLLSEGDLLFAAKGFVNFCTVYGKNQGDAVASSSFLVLKIKDTEKVIPEYLSWYLNRDDILFIFRNMTSGNVMPSISKAMMENLDISIPSIYVQNQIIKIAALSEKEGLLLEQIKHKHRELIQKKLIQIINK